MRVTNIAAQLSAAGAISILIRAAAVHAAPILWISDQNGNIGQVDIATQSVVAGSVHNTGQPLTDIGFDSAGNLFGTTFTGLFAIDKTTGAATPRGTYAGESGMNALVGTTTPGTLLGASFTNKNLYTINSANAGLGVNKVLTVPVPSAGDLAFVGTTLYESAGPPGGPGQLVADELVNATTDTEISIFSIGGPGGQRIANVFGLADDGTTLYAVAGTNVYSVNPANAAVTLLFDYSLNENGQNLVAATGSDFLNQQGPIPPTGVPEPASLGLLGTALAALALGVKLRLKAA